MMVFCYISTVDSFNSKGKTEPAMEEFSFGFLKRKSTTSIRVADQ